MILPLTTNYNVVLVKITRVLTHLIFAESGVCVGGQGQRGARPGAPGLLRPPHRAGAHRQLHQVCPGRDP